MRYQELLDIVNLLNNDKCKILGDVRLRDEIHQGIINLIGVAGEVLEVLEMKEQQYPGGCGVPLQEIDFKEGYNTCLREIKKKLGGREK